ncbi:MAG TPA: enoyl-CoA hydratase-related protein [Syntrophorhabdaceae bacterium]|jgi:enoyl-CoA hydratase|nr:enoyl-CoA hydratase-related protein [Syntrophorhabdaceae bacterium]HNT67802.1 enoyl-CoA hydratase-related protein [Syntrophorhabdaceae bacterium]
MGYETLIIEREEPVGIIKLNRPPVNPLSVKLYHELYDAVCEFENDDAIGAIIITGNGDKAFAAGLDIKDVMGKSAVETLDFLWTAPRKTFDKLTGIGKPTIAALFGLALGGGCEVALCCDLRIAAEDTVIGLPEIGLGIMPGSGATQRLPRLIGVAKAKEMIYTGDNINAAEAYRVGLVNKVVPKEKLMEEAKAMAKKLAAKPKAAFALIKRCIDNGLNMNLASGLTMEMDSFSIAFTSEDGREGINAFVEKRKPNYKGK